MELEPYYCLPVGAMPQPTAIPWSQPTSPTPPTRGIGGILSPTHGGGHRIGYPKKNDEGKLALLAQQMSSWKGRVIGIYLPGAPLSSFEPCGFQCIEVPSKKILG